MEFKTKLTLVDEGTTSAFVVLGRRIACVQINKILVAEEASSPIHVTNVDTEGRTWDDDNVHFSPEGAALMLLFNYYKANPKELADKEMNKARSEKDKPIMEAMENLLTVAAEATEEKDTAEEVVVTPPAEKVAETVATETEAAPAEKVAETEAAPAEKVAETVATETEAAPAEKVAEEPNPEE